MAQGQGRLLEIWEVDAAKNLDSFILQRGEDILPIVVGNTYLFAHPGVKNIATPTFDQLWKGVVVEIKHIPLQDDAMLRVIWFWAKKDIERAMKGRAACDGLSAILDSMAENEICAGTEGVINSSDAVSYDVSVVYLESQQEKLHTQEPVVDYFFRMVWEEREQVLKTDPPGCGRERCYLTWNPDTQEQRYCDVCVKWYHISCLRAERQMDQTAIRDQAMATFELPPLPRHLYDVAYQPIARGGPVHFTAGNIRIVMKARELVKNTAEREKVTQGLEWTQDEWTQFLNEFHGLQGGSDDNVNEERLLITGQKVYQCNCSITLI